MSSSSSVQRRPSSRHSGVRTRKDVPDPASFFTTVLLAAILVSGPLVLGAARLWFELPWLGAVALLLLIQGLRLVRRTIAGTLRQIDAIDFSVILFAVYAVIRWLTSPAEYFSRIETMDIVAYAGIFLTCRYGIGHRKFGLALLFGLVGLGIFETGFGYYLSRNLDWFPFGVTERLHLWYAPRWVGTYGCPNHYGGLLEMAIGAAIAFGCFSKLPWPARIFLFYIAGMMMVGVMFSLSRGTYLGLTGAILALTIFGLRHGTVRWWVPLTATLVLVVSAGVLFSLSPNVRDRYLSAHDAVANGQLSTYVRIQLAKDALHIAADHPVFGTGPGTFVFIHPKYQDPTFDRKAVLTHDDYLNCLDDYGLVGFAIAMFFIAAVTLTFLKPLWADNRWQDRVMVATGFAAWGALLIHSVFDFNLHIPANAMLFFALVALGLGRIKRDETVRHWSTLPLTPAGPWLGWAIVLFSLFYGFQVGRAGVSNIIYEQAYDQALEVPTSQSIQDAERALAYDPRNVQALVFLGDLHRYDASRQEEIESRISEGMKAMQYYQQAAKLNSLDDSINAKMGMTFDIMRRYSEAFFCYKDAVTAQPYNGQFWYWLGNHYWQRDMLDKAEQAYRMAAKCPYGKDGSEEAIQELHSLPGRQNLSEPIPDVNPVESTEAATANHPDTIP